MKQASAAAKAILATGQYKRADLFDIALSGSTQVYSYTSAQLPIPFNNKTYQTGVTITRGSTKQSVGLTVQSVDITFTPQDDSPYAPALLAGFPFLEACKRRVLDGARITWSKMFLADFADTSPGATPWFQGRVNRISIDRFSAVITVNSDIEILNVQMPPNIIAPGCIHTLFDAGCGLSPSSYTNISTVAAGSDVLHVITNVVQPNDYFTLGRITFTSGVLAGISRNVKAYQATGGVFTLPYPLPSVPAAGITFTALPGCDKMTTTCTNKFGNIKRHRGYPYVPVPETLYDGGNIVQGSRQDFGGQGGAKTGSPFGGSSGARTYKA